MSRTRLNETEYPIGFMCLKIQYLLIHCLAPCIVLCLRGRGYQTVPVQSSPGNGKKQYSRQAWPQLFLAVVSCS